MYTVCIQLSSSMSDIALFLRAHSARPCHTFKKSFNLWSYFGKGVAQEVKSWILDEFNECDQQTPWMGSVYNQTFQQDPCDLLLHFFVRCMLEQA